MPAYMIADLKIADQTEWSGYDLRVSEVVAHYGGRFIVRGGDVETLEGSWCPDRLVILEFPDQDAIRRFYTSDLYAPLLAKRLGAASTNLITVKGLAPSAPT